MKTNIVIIIPLAGSFTVYKARCHPYRIYWPQHSSEVSSTYTARSVLEPPTQTLSRTLPQKTRFSCHTPLSVLDSHLLQTSCLWVPNSVLLPEMGSSFLLVLFLVIRGSTKMNLEHLFLLPSLKLTSVSPPCNARLNLLPSS